MTATIPPTSVPPRRRADETPRKARRRAPETEGNQAEAPTVDKSMPETPRTPPEPDTSRARKARTGAATPPRARSGRADAAVPPGGRRTTGKAPAAPRATGEVR